jgi:N-acetylmuramoyl-L-alanine amidase
MRNLVFLGAGIEWVSILAIASVALADQPLFVAYPPDGHETTSAQIFLIGTAPPLGEVFVNGQAIDRSTQGHFAPSFPLQIGANEFMLRYRSQTLTVNITRMAANPPVPIGTAFAEGSLTPTVNIARMLGETVCFGAIAPPRSQVSVTLAHQNIPLLPQPNLVTLPPNSAVLTSQNQPVTLTTSQGYQGCTVLNTANIPLSPNPDSSVQQVSPNTLIYGNNITTGAVIPSSDIRTPEFHLSLNGQMVTQRGAGTVEVLSSTNPQVVEVTAESGTARTGASTDYSRLTPLPSGTRAAVTGREGDWLRLDYGGWIRASETQVVDNAALPQTLIRSITSRQANDWTEIVFPLQVAVPLAVQQGDRTFTLTLYNTTAQTDLIRLIDNPVVDRLDWQQIAPGQVQYRFYLKSSQQWGYKLRYEKTSLVLSLRNPPTVSHAPADPLPLTGVRILLDPGHGGPEDLGSRGPTGDPEKEQTLAIAKLLRQRLTARGAIVLMTREGDVDLYPQDRVNLINQLEPTIALSLHYNALPDEGDAVRTSGVSTYWYNPQAQSLAAFLQNYLVRMLDRPSYGVFWDNLALTRPTIAPCVLIELGFMINPQEFEWITDPQQQQQLADALADGITQWLQAVGQSHSGE